MEKQDIFYKGKEIISIKDGVLFFEDIQRSVLAYSSKGPIEVRGDGGVQCMDMFYFRNMMDEALVQTPCVLKKVGKR